MGYSPPSTAIAIAVVAIGGFANAQELCASQPDVKTHAECAAAVMEPIEVRLKQAYDSIEPKFVNEAKTSLAESQRNWNAYRHNQCFLEGMAIQPPDTSSNLASLRAFFMCVHRLTVQRVIELEKLK